MPWLRFEYQCNQGNGKAAMQHQQKHINECNLASVVNNAEFQLYSAVKLWLFLVNNAGRVRPK